MRIAVPREIASGERRVALVPETVARLRKGGFEVVVQRGAGSEAGFPDDQYAAAGATLVDGAREVYASGELVLKVQRPTLEEVELIAEGGAIAGLLQPFGSPEVLDALARRRITAFAMELVPRITRAQSMDALSSQAVLAGYKAVIVAAEAMPRILPMLTTAAGTLAPAKAFILGAGVAGLQAIATARRLGAIVSAFDVRPAVKEQVQSLGATFVEAEVVAEGAGGYAKELAADQQQRVLDAIGRQLPQMDLVISTAQVPGKRAPLLLTAAMVRSMKPGSVVVDLAAETGGNCELTRPNEVVEEAGVRVLGPVNLPATVPLHASQTYSRNLQALLAHVAKDGALTVDLADEITGAMVICHAGERRSR